MTGSVSGDGTRASRNEATTGGDAATRGSEDGVPRGARVDSDGLFATVMRGIEVDARTGLLFSDLVRVVASRCAAMEEGEIPVLLVEAVDVHESVETVLAAFSRLAAEEARPFIAGAFDGKRAVCIIPDGDIADAHALFARLLRQPQTLSRLDRTPSVAAGIATFRRAATVEQTFAEAFQALALALKKQDGCSVDAESAVRAEVANRAPTSVLVVDDDASTRALIAASLQGSGFRVFEAREVLAAETLVEEESIDVIVLDISLPGIDGLRVAERLRGRASTSKIPLMFVSGRSDTASRVEGLAFGDDYLSKPFARAELVARVRNLAMLRCAQP